MVSTAMFFIKIGAVGYRFAVKEYFRVDHREMVSNVIFFK
jgi:hypothetical protein